MGNSIYVFQREIQLFLTANKAKQTEQSMGFLGAEEALQWQSDYVPYMKPELQPPVSSAAPKY